MSNNEFTKGGWVASMPEHSNGFWFIDKELSIIKSGYIATCYGDNAKNDAQLIAAAPEMYEALRQMLDSYIDIGGNDIEYIEEVKELLAKARGEK